MAESADRLLSTGDAGLDQVLNGGLNRGRPYLLRGASGTGKTTLGLQFLRAGAMEGASCLFIALSESEADLRMIAASHGWSLEGVAVYDASSYIAARERSEQSLFDSDEVELDEIVERILAEVRERRPTLLVIDAVSEVFTLSKSAIRFRRQLYAFKMLFQELDCTALLIDSSPGRSGEESELNDLAHGVIEIESELLAYGRLRRVLHVSKYRARAYLSGRHDLRITEGEGMHVFPRTSASPGRPGSQAARGVVQSGLPELDTLLGDGILGGTSTLVVGPAGSGKSSLANLYAYTAAQRGEASVIYLFDESRETYLRRAEGLGIPMKAFCEQGRVVLRELAGGEVTPGEFAQIARQDAAEVDARIMVIDSLTGYGFSMLDRHFLLVHIHELLADFSSRGIASLLVSTEHGLLTPRMAASQMEISYIADAIILLRHFEAFGNVRQAISVIKKRYGQHEKTVRELAMSSKGIVIGEPIEAFTGVLTGHPRFEGKSDQLLRSLSNTQGGRDDAEANRPSKH